jgi:hypothetical protein
MLSSPSVVSEPSWFSKVWSLPGETGSPNGAIKQGITTDNQPASSSETKAVSWGHTTKVHLYDENAPPHIPGPDGVLMDHLALPPGREGYLAKVAAEQSPPQPPPKPKGFASNLKTYFDKLGKLNFRPRFQPAYD